MRNSWLGRLAGWTALFATRALLAGIVATNLECGSWTNPLGIDAAQPRLTWQLQANPPGARAQLQTACRVLVASSAKHLAKNVGDLWDSGRVGTALPSLNYGGKPLVSEQAVFWKVQVWDQDGEASTWSAPATWTMGLLAPASWKGAWLTASTSPADNFGGCNSIWYPEGNPTAAAPAETRYFRKTFVVKAAPVTRATLLLTADNSYTTCLNGTMVGQGQDWNRATALPVATQLVPGTNVLAIAASNSSVGPEGLIGKVVVEYRYGGQAVIPMDATWKTANAWQTGWQSPGFDDGAWKNALVLGGYGIGPWNNGVAPGPETALPIFRREFEVRPGLQRAVISICGLGQYELSANGVKVGKALLAPGWTKYDRTCLYDTLDITANLHRGKNVLGVMLGNGFYNIPGGSGRYDWPEQATGKSPSSGPPRVIAQLHLYYQDGTDQVIATDGQWQTTPGPITFSSIYGGEDYNPQRLAAGWNQAGFNAAGWSAPQLTNGPGGILRGTSHAAPPIIATQTNQTVAIHALSARRFNYDLGQNASILPRLDCHGPAGAVIRLTPTELLNPDGSPNPMTDDPGGAPRYWQYTLAGTGQETWQPQFYYAGCRYLQVELIPATGSPQLPVVDRLAGVCIQSSVAPAGDFSCSFDMFNRTRTLIRWAQRNNLVSVITDCPHRERLGYLEQYHLHGPSLSYEFDMGQLFAKTMDDMADSQADIGTGLVPFFCPEYWHFHISTAFRDTPEWGSSAIIVPWQHYLYTGDPTLVKNYYATMTNYFYYLQRQAVNDFLKYNALGDWATVGQTTPVSLTADAYYYLDAQICAQAAARLGKTAEAADFNQLATKIAAAFNRTYYSATNGEYANGSQTAQAMPLALGIVPPEDQAKVLSKLVANVNANGLSFGEIGHPYVLRALAGSGRSDVVYKLHSDATKPGYGYMLNQGATALTEAWNAEGNSQDHFMLGHIIEWFYHDLAGIQWDPAAPGYQNIIIKPAFVGHLTWVKASYNSVRGMIVSDWTLTNNAATLEVKIPAGSTSQVWLPLAADVSPQLTVTESGKPIWQNGAATGRGPGVAFNRFQSSGTQTYLVWSVGSGSYQFAWNLPPTSAGIREP